jgi:hypothetical protein
MCAIIAATASGASAGSNGIDLDFLIASRWNLRPVSACGG